MSYLELKNIFNNSNFDYAVERSKISYEHLKSYFYEGHTVVWINQIINQFNQIGIQIGNQLKNNFLASTCSIIAVSLSSFIVTHKLISFIDRKIFGRIQESEQYIDSSFISKFSHLTFSPLLTGAIQYQILLGFCQWTKVAIPTYIQIICVTTSIVFEFTIKLYLIEKNEKYIKDTQSKIQEENVLLKAREQLGSIPLNKPEIQSADPKIKELEQEIERLKQEVLQSQEKLKQQESDFLRKKALYQEDFNNQSIQTYNQQKIDYQEKLKEKDESFENSEKIWQNQKQNWMETDLSQKQEIANLKLQLKEPKQEPEKTDEGKLIIEDLKIKLLQTRKEIELLYEQIEELKKEKTELVEKVDTLKEEKENYLMMINDLTTKPENSSNTETKTNN